MHSISTYPQADGKSGETLRTVLELHSKRRWGLEYEKQAKQKQHGFIQLIRCNPIIQNQSDLKTSYLQPF